MITHADQLAIGEKDEVEQAGGAAVLLIEIPLKSSERAVRRVEVPYKPLPQLQHR